VVYCNGDAQIPGTRLPKKLNFLWLQLIFVDAQHRTYRISRPIRHTFFSGKYDLNSVSDTPRVSIYFQTYKYPYIY
jgi:hypothetical protein